MDDRAPPIDLLPLDPHRVGGRSLPNENVVGAFGVELLGLINQAVNQRLQSHYLPFLHLFVETFLSLNSNSAKDRY